MWGTQFHPEKSGTVGLGVLANFVPRSSGGHRPGLMDLYPADRHPRRACVRLAQGDFERGATTATRLRSPAAFAAAGAPWLHVVDLDAARTGSPVNRAWWSPSPRRSTSRSRPAAGCAPSPTSTSCSTAGVARVVLGTAALEDPGLAPRGRPHSPAGSPSGSTTGGTGRPGEVVVRGWTEGSGGPSPTSSGGGGAGLAAVIVTEIGRDGTLAGPDVEGLPRVLGSTGVPVIASGGVASAGDLEALARLCGGARSRRGTDPASDGVSSGPSWAGRWSTAG